MLHWRASHAEVAQLVEQPIRNRQVAGSIPALGSTHLLSSCCTDQFTSLDPTLPETRSVKDVRTGLQKFRQRFGQVHIGQQWDQSAEGLTQQLAK